MQNDQTSVPAQRRQGSRPDLVQAFTGWLIMSLGLLVAMIMRSQDNTETTQKGAGPEGTRSLVPG
jgi:hypothetical protein